MSVCTGTLYDHVPVYMHPRVAHIHCIVRLVQVYACVCSLHIPVCVCVYVCTCMHTMYTHRARVCLHTRACVGMHMLPAHAYATLAQTDDSEAPVPHGYLNESSGCPPGHIRDTMSQVRVSAQRGDTACFQLWDLLLSTPNALELKQTRDPKRQGWLRTPVPRGCLPPAWG